MRTIGASSRTLHVCVLYSSASRHKVVTVQTCVRETAESARDMATTDSYKAAAKFETKWGVLAPLHVQVRIGGIREGARAVGVFRRAIRKPNREKSVLRFRASRVGKSENG